MLPIAPLMIEHRLIEKMIALMQNRLEEQRATGRVDVEFLDDAVRFVRVYADRTHHGKEEDILFRDLANREMSEEHRRTMAELVEEHGFGRKTVAALADARMRYAGGDASALAEMSNSMEVLVGFYPRHIEKEDRHFFIPVMEYFSSAEQAAMLDECNEFDRRMIHEHFRTVVDNWRLRPASRH